MYRILCLFRDEGSSASTPSHVLEALAFFDSVARFFYMRLDDVLSSRCRGVARDMFLTKEPLKQRDQFLCKQVSAFEDIILAPG